MSRKLIEQMLAEMKHANELAINEIGMGLIDARVISSAEEFLVKPEPDPLQGAANLIVGAWDNDCTTTIQRTLRIDYNRASRLFKEAKL